MFILTYIIIYESRCGTSITEKIIFEAYTKELHQQD